MLKEGFGELKLKKRRNCVCFGRLEAFDDTIALQRGQCQIEYPEAKKQG